MVMTFHCLGTFMHTKSNVGTAPYSRDSERLLSVVRHAGMVGERYLAGIDSPQSDLSTPQKQTGGTLANGVRSADVNGFRANQKGVP
jgi:hypothetical protein